MSWVHDTLAAEHVVPETAAIVLHTEEDQDYGNVDMHDEVEPPGVGVGEQRKYLKVGGSDFFNITPVSFKKLVTAVHRKLFATRLSGRY